MKITGRFTLLLLGLTLVYSFVYAATGETVKDKRSNREKLAVLDLEANYGVEDDFAKALSVIIRDEIHSYGEYEVMSTADLQAVMSREAMLQAMGCAEDGACLVSFGRAIGTRFMVAGALSKLGSTYNISLRMLDTKGENAGVVKRTSEYCKCSEDDLIVAVQNVSAALMGEETQEMMFSGKVAAKKIEEIKKGRLTVSANPADALVRILNIRPRYIAGIELFPGLYHLEVSRRDYRSEDKWIELKAGEDLVLNIRLQRGKAQEVTAAVSLNHSSGTGPKSYDIPPLHENRILHSVPVTAEELEAGRLKKYGQGQPHENPIFRSVPVTAKELEVGRVGKYTQRQPNGNRILRSIPVTIEELEAGRVKKYGQRLPHGNSIFRSVPVTAQELEAGRVKKYR